MYSVYILRGLKNHLYIGVTSDLCGRMKRHMDGTGAEFTYRNITFKVVYVEKFESLVLARRREAQIKGWRREKKENLIRFGKP